MLEGPLGVTARQLADPLFGAAAGDGAISPPSVVLPVVAFLTPAAGELLLFFGTLMFFLAGQLELRAQLVALFADRDVEAALPQDHERRREAT